MDNHTGYKKIIDQNGIWIYYNEKLHNENGPAVEFYNGDKEWWINGKRHRTNGPAIIIKTGRMEWYRKGLLHRDTGPAIVDKNHYKEWWWNGSKITDKKSHPLASWLFKHKKLTKWRKGLTTQEDLVTLKLMFDY